MNAPATTLTDFALALECGAFAWMLGRERAAAAPLRRGLVTFFAALSLAALLGGLVHGFPSACSPRTAVCWRGTLLALGVGAFACWRAGGLIAFPRASAAVSAGAALALLLYARSVLDGAVAFRVALVFVLPASVFLLAAFFLHGRRTGCGRPAALGLAGVLAGSALQQAGVGLAPLHLDPNALYHVIVAGALLLVFAGAREVAAGRAADRVVAARVADRKAPAC